MRKNYRFKLLSGIYCLFTAIFCLLSSSFLYAASPTTEDLYQQFKNYWAIPVWQALKPEVLKEMVIPRSDENKSYFTIDGIEKISWSERIKQRNEWRQKSIIDTIHIDSILRLDQGENSDGIFTVSDGIEGLDPTNPDVAYDPVNQKYLVVWEEETSPGIFGIMGQFRDRNGNPMGTPTLFSTPRASQGCFHAAFDTDNRGISTPTNCPKAANPAVAYNNGRFIIVWELKGRADHARNADGFDNESGKNFSNLIAKLVNAENLSVVSPAWQEGILISRVQVSSNVGTPVANDAQVQAWAKSVNPDVAPKLGSDGFVVTWQSDRDFIGCVSPDRRASSSIFARYVDQNFSPTGGATNKPVFTVYADPSTVTMTCPSLDNVMKAVNPRIAYNSNRSDFVIAFEHARAVGASKTDIAAKKVSLNNTHDATVFNSLVVDIVAAAEEEGHFHNPDVASYAQHTLLAYDDGSNIFLKKFTTNANHATPVGEATNINLGGTGAKREPRIASNLSVGGTRTPPSMAPQRALIAYTQGGSMKWAITDDTFMVLRGPSTFPVMANNNHLAEVASDLNNFFVAWAGTPAGSMIENVFGASVNSLDDLGAVVLTSPADMATLTELSVNLTWNAVTGSGIVYDVYLGVGGAAPMIVSTGQAGSSFMANNLSWGTAYQWRVVVRDSFGRTGSSLTRNFTTIPALEAPVLTAPANAANVTTPSVSLTWNAVPNALALGAVYDVFEGQGALPGLPVASGLAATNHTVNGLVSQTARQWKVRVRDMHGRQAESEIRSYNVGNLNMPTAPTLAAQPADNVTWAPTRLYLSWMASTDADVGDTVTYDVYFEPVAGAMDPLPMGAVPYRAGVAGTNFIIQASTDNRPQYQPTPAWTAAHPMGTSAYLTANSHYAWKICANDGRNNPPGITCSPVRHFNTDNSVVGWWRFDENPVGAACPAILGGPVGDMGETVCDYSGFGNHGAPNGGPVWLVPPMAGILGGALQFDGVNDFVSIPNTVSINPNSLSVVTVIKNFGAVGEQQILDKRGAGAAYNLRVLGDAYPLQIQFVITDSNGVPYHTGTPAIINNLTRYHIISTFDQLTGETVVYLDGMNVVNQNFGVLDRNMKTAINLILGNIAGVGISGWYTGLMDEVIILNKTALSFEVINNYNSEN